MPFFAISNIVILSFILAPLCASQEFLGPVPAQEAPQPTSIKEHQKSPAQAPKGAQIAVIVNKDVISYQDLYDRAALVLMSHPGKPSQEEVQKVLPQVKNSLIQERIQLQVCKELKIIVSPSEVNDSLSAIAKQNNMSLDDMKKLFKERGVNIQTLEQRTKAQLGWMRAVRDVFGQLVIVSEKEALEALTKAREDLHKTRQELMEIVMYVDDPKHDGRVKADITNVAANLNSGVPFRVLAQQFSQSTSASNGGYLGWFAKGTRSPMEEEALAKLKPGQFTAPIRFSGGYRILYVKDMQRPGEAPLSESKLTYLTAAIPYGDSLSNAEKELIAYHLEALKTTATDCEQFTNKIKEWQYHLEAPVTESFNDLPDPLEKLFAQAKLGTVLGPIRMGEHLMVYMLCRRENAGKVKEPTLDEITNQLQAQKLERMATREFNRLTSMAFVDDKMAASTK